MKHIPVFLLMISFNEVSAHKDFCKTFNIQNVTSRIKTGYNFEIINHTELVGKLVSELSSKLDYQQPIFIDFMHDYIGENTACQYAVGFNKVFQCGDDLENGKMHGETLISEEIASVSIVGSNYVIQDILMLVEALIRNHYSITNEITCDNHSIVHHWRGFKSIDQSTIKKIISKKPSMPIESILNDSIYLSSFQKGDLSYYWQNNSFYVQEIKWSFSTNSYRYNTFDTLSNILQLEKVGNSYFIFANDSTFRFIDKSSDTFITQPIRLERQSEAHFRPYKIFEISTDRFTINANGRISLLTYKRKENSIELLMNLDEQLKK